MEEAPITQLKLGANLMVRNREVSGLIPANARTHRRQATSVPICRTATPRSRSRQTSISEMFSSMTSMRLKNLPLLEQPACQFHRFGDGHHRHLPSPRPHDPLPRRAAGHLLQHLKNHHARALERRLAVTHLRVRHDIRAECHRLMLAARFHARNLPQPALAAVIVLAGFTREVTVKTGARLPIFSMQGLDNRFKAFLLAAILFTLGNSSDSFIILRGQERGLSLLQIMLMLMTFNLVYSVLAGPFGALSDRFGRRRLILAGWMAYGLVYIGFAMADTGVQIWVLFGVYGLYYALTEGAAKAFVADLVPPERRGTAYGLYNAAIALTAFPASLIAGFLWQGVGSWNGFGPRAPFIFGAILALLAAGLFLTIKFNQNFKKPETV